MARPGISYFDVAKAATALVEAEQQPTIDKIRRHLGSGSNSTIANHLKRWKAEHMPAGAATNNTTLPPLLLNQLQALWDALKETANQELKTQQESEKKLQQSLSSLQAKFDAEIKKQNQTAEEKAALQNALTEKVATIETGNASIHTLQLQCKAHEQRLADKDVVIADLHKQIQNLSNNFEHFQQAAQAQRQQDSLEFSGQLNEREVKIQSLKSQRDELEKQLQLLLIEKERVQFRVDQLSLENDKSKSTAEEKSQLLITLRCQLQRSDEDLRLAADKLLTLEEKLSKQSNQMAALQIKHTATSTKLAILERQAKEQAAEMAQLRRNALENNKIKESA